jgi:polyisoprenoid-binding protein YceI
MRKTTIATTLGCLAFCATLIAQTSAIRAADTATTIRPIDPARSKAQFSIQHIFVDRVTGTVSVRGGTVELPAGSDVPTSVTAELDPSRIHTDEPDRDASLEGPDYFDVKAFPTWSFASTRIVKTGPQTFEMDGTLTMHGVGNPEQFAVTIAGTPADPVYHATATIDRHAFGMKGTRLDPVIGNTADVTLDVALK